MDEQRKLIHKGVTYAPSIEEYHQTLEVCDELKSKLNELKILLHGTVGQDLSIPYGKYKNDMVNWIEEIEFYINEYLNR